MITEDILEYLPKVKTSINGFSQDFEATNYLWIKHNDVIKYTFEPLNVNPYDGSIFFIEVPISKVPIEVKRQFLLDEIL